MNLAILETGHFQYALTQAEVFSDADIVFITTPQIHQQIVDYSPEFTSANFRIIESIQNDFTAILDLIDQEKIELFLISPVFADYKYLLKIVQNAQCTKVLTTHNINTWFNGRFWSPNSLKDRLNMQAIIKNSDYIAVEDFIYNHLKSTNHKYFQKHQFLYIPFTIFHPGKPRKYAKTEDRVKIVLTGHIDGDRRRYEDVIQVIEQFIGRSSEVVFSFAGRAKGDYGKGIQNQLREIKKKDPELVLFFEDDSTADDFRREMETSDIVLSTSTKTFKGMGTVEFIGQTKPTAAIHDMMSYELPGWLPAHLKVPKNLEGSVFNYDSAEDMAQKIDAVVTRPELLQSHQAKAKENSLKFTAAEIRKNLPF